MKGGSARAFMTSVSSVSLVGAIGCVVVNEGVVARRVGMRGQGDWVGFFNGFRSFALF